MGSAGKSCSGTDRHVFGMARRILSVALELSTSPSPRIWHRTHTSAWRRRRYRATTPTIQDIASTRGRARANEGRCKNGFARGRQAPQCFSYILARLVYGSWPLAGGRQPTGELLNQEWNSGDLKPHLTALRRRKEADIAVTHVTSQKLILAISDLVAATHENHKNVNPREDACEFGPVACWC